MDWVVSNSCPVLKKYLSDDLNQDEYKKYLSICVANPHTAPYEALYGHTCKKKQTVHPFNIFSFRADLAATETVGEQRLRKVESIIENGFPAGIVTPGHALAVAGVRKVCCGDPNDSQNQERCYPEWKVIDSDSEVKDGDNWFAGDSFAGNVSRIDSILPCGPKLGIECFDHVQSENSSRSEIDLIREARDPKSLEAFLKKKPLSGEEHFELVKRFAREGSPTMLELALGKGPQSFTDAQKAEIVESAANSGSHAIIMYLIDKKFDVGPALGIAAGHGYSAGGGQRAGKHEIVKFLINHGINVNVKDSRGRTPLFPAVQNGRAEIVRYLVDKGADVHARDNEGNSVLSRLVFKEDPETLQIAAFILDKGLDPKKQNKYGDTAFHLAVQSANLPLLKLIQQKSGPCEVKNNRGQTPLQNAAKELHEMRNPPKSDLDEFFGESGDGHGDEVRQKKYEEIIEFLSSGKK